MPTVIKVNELPAMVGKELPASSWMEIDQERIDQFADATNDHQFIHVDPQAAAKTPFGTTIAHGFLTLSLLSYLTSEQSIRPEGLTMGLNYGLDRVRFLQPVLTGSRIRVRQKIVEMTEKKPGQWLMRTAVTMEIENTEKPAMIAEFLVMFIIR
jgi:acyl dehydratase